MQIIPRAKILLVDDKQNNLLSLESIFLKDDYQLISANSGKDALKILLKEHDFTLILMDVEMPDLNGFETATMIYQREKLQHIPILFITAHSHDDEKIFKAYRSGAVDYIYKPIRPELLRAKVAVYAELFRKNHLLMEQEQKLKAANRSLENEVKDRIASEEKINHLNKQLLKNIEQLESTNKELDQFAFIASHDLQEPLRKIRTFSDRIAMQYSEKLDADGRLYLEKMQAACERMQNLINDILEFSKIAGTKDAFVYSDMNIILREVLSDMDLQIQEKKAKIKLEILPSLYIYPSLIKPLFANILHNALKYSKKDVIPEITISSNIEEQRFELRGPRVKRYCRISIQDNGVGFEQKYAEQIFNMFKRLHGNSEYQGTGIGLAICKKIAEEHHAYIAAKGVPNEGAIFTISFPLEIPVINQNKLMQEQDLDQK